MLALELARNKTKIEVPAEMLESPFTQRIDLRSAKTNNHMDGWAEKASVRDLAGPGAKTIVFQSASKVKASIRYRSDTACA